MVQEYVSPVRIHKYPFEMVMAAYERRFPSCPQIPVVIECVITEDIWSADDSQRHTVRRCQLNVDAPYLLKKMIGVDYIYFIQKNHLDLKSRVLEIEATNESFATRVSVIEKCRYFEHPDNPEWTCFEQSAILDVKNFFGLESTVEKIAMKQYAANIAKGKELIEVFMQGLQEEGTQELRRWSASEPRLNRELRRVLSRAKEPLSPRGLADNKRLSLPGTSQIGNWTNSLSLKKSSQKLIKNRSKSAVSIKDQKQNSSRSPEIKRSSFLSSLNLHRSKQKLDSPPSTTKLLPRKSDPKDENKKEEEKRRRLTISTPDLTAKYGTDSSLNDHKVFKSCNCDPPIPQVNVPQFFSTWDNLVIVLLCAMFIVLLLSAPVSSFFGRRRETS